MNVPEDAPRAGPARLETRRALSLTTPGMDDVMRVLIIEDDEDTRLSLQDLLELDSHDVSIAGNLKQAFRWEDPAEFDLVIIDRRLPDGLAEDLLPQIKKRYPQADTIVVTGFADLEGTIAALREGVSDYLQKPLAPDLLLSGVRRIARRRQIERELERQRAFAESILDTAEAIILVLEPSGKILRVNPFFSELTGFTQAEALGKDWFEHFIPQEERARVRKIFQRTAMKLETRGVINSILTKTGTRSIRWSNTTFNDEAGRTTAVLSVGLDVSDLIHAQEQLLQAERLAAIGETVTGLAHESRNALQRINATLDILELQFEDDPEVLRDLKNIHHAAQHLRELLDQVRSYAAPIHLETTETHLETVWRRAWDHVRMVVKRDARLVERINDSPLLAEVDASRMEQVFRNLFENAIEASPEPAKIELTGRIHEGHIVVTLCDNGPGIKGPDAKRIFDAFFTTKPTGTGLGLAIVKRIVEAHGGRIELNPEGDRAGAHFRIHLPCAAPQCREWHEAVI